AAPPPRPRAGVRAFSWPNDGVDAEPVTEYSGTRTEEGDEHWRRSAFYHLHQTGESEVRRRIGSGDPADFELLGALRAQGHTDYLAMVYRFESEGMIGEFD